MKERLQRLEVNVRELERFSQRYTSQDVRRDPHLEWALRYGLLEAIQIAIDLSCHLVSEKNLGAPATYAECVEMLRRARILDDHLADVISGMSACAISRSTGTSLWIPLACTSCWIGLTISDCSPNRLAPILGS